MWRLRYVSCGRSLRMRLEGLRAVGCDDAGRARSWRLKELEACASAEQAAGFFMVMLRAHMKRLGELLQQNHLRETKAFLVAIQLI